MTNDRCFHCIFLKFLSLKRYYKLLSHVRYALNRYIITLIVILYASHCPYGKAFIVAEFYLNNSSISVPEDRALLENIQAALASQLAVQWTHSKRLSPW